jgi:hypothetical protein
VVLLLLSSIAIAMAALPWVIRLVLFTVLAGYGGYAIRQLRMLPADTLECRNGDWGLRTNGVLQPVTLGDEYFLAYGILSLPFYPEPDGKTVRVLLWPDSADADNLRRLRAVLLAR